MAKSFLEAGEVKDLTGNVQAKFFFADDKEEKKEEEEDQGDRKGGKIGV